MSQLTMTREEREAFLGDLYIGDGEVGDDVLVSVRPERWLTVDYQKQYADLGESAGVEA